MGRYENMKKKRSIFIILTVCLVLIILTFSQYLQNSALWEFKHKNKEVYQLLKRGYLILVPIDELKSSGMMMELGEKDKIELDKTKLFQEEPNDYSQFNESYGWTILEKNKIEIYYVDEWDTLSNFRVTSNTNIFATYELLGDDGSYAKYTVKIQ